MNESDNRQLLLRKACELFAQKGYDSVGVQSIVKACDLTKPTLYHYFGCKEGLLKEVLEQGFTQLNQSLDSLGPYEQDLPIYLEQMAQVWMGNVRQQPDFFRVELSLVFLPQEHPAHLLAMPGHQILLQRMQELFTSAARDHGNMEGNSLVLASSWLGLLHHWTGIYVGGWGDPGDSSFLHSSLRTFLYGIFT